MDAQRFKDAYARLEYLDESLTHKVRRPGRGRLHSPSAEELDEALKTLGAYTIELKDIVRELFLAIGSKAKGKNDPT
ncbi:MAG TPA: hypothetical protein VMR44_07935 [Thermoanaerobaculia bacterium]|nr:hypothetical protein [Thermoanaerobaculia bacterium]